MHLRHLAGLIALLSVSASAQNFGPILTNIPVTLQCDSTGTAYAIGDTWSNMVTLTNAFRANNGTARIVSFSLLSSDDTSPTLTVLAFSRPFSVGLTNAAWAVSNADMAYCIATIPVYQQDYADCGTNRVALKPAVNVPILNTWTNRNLYLGIIAQSTETLTNQPIINVAFSQD